MDSNMIKTLKYINNNICLKFINDLFIIFLFNFLFNFSIIYLIKSYIKNICYFKNDL